MVGISGVTIPQGVISGQIDRIQNERTGQPPVQKQEQAPPPPPAASERGAKVDVVA